MSQNQFAADFLDVLASILDEVLTDQIDERCVLKGLPDWLLQPLERQLNGNKLDLASGKSVVVVLVDESSSSSLTDPRFPMSGRYNHDRLTEIRNHCELSWVAVCPNGGELNSSNEDTSRDLGNMLQNLLEHNLRRIFPEDQTICGQISALIEKHIKVNQVHKIHGAEELKWQLAAKLSDIEPSPDALDLVIARLGHIKCDGSDLAKEEYSSLLKRAVAEAENEGLNKFFTTLIERAETIFEAPQDIQEALSECLGHLRGSVVDGATWSTKPNIGYSPCDSHDAPPQWWFLLNASVWSLLLKPEQKVAPQKSSIEITGGIEIGEKNRWVLLPDRELASATFKVDGVATPCNWHISEGKKAFVAAGFETASLSLEEIVNENVDVFNLKVDLPDGSISSDDLVPVWSHQIGVCPNVLGATSVSIPTTSNLDEDTYNSAVRLPREGVYTCDLCLADGVEVHSIVGEDISPDLEGAKSDISFVPINGARPGQITFQLQSDESCTYRILFRRSAVPDKFFTLKLSVDAESETAGVSGSEYQALIRSHVERKVAGAPVAASRNDDSLLARLGGWLLEEEDSWTPAAVVAGKALPTVLSDGWRQAKPLNGDDFARDIRPAGELNPPSQLLNARRVIRQKILESVIETGGTIEAARLWELCAEEAFSSQLEVYCSEYADWLSKDDSASWFDVVTVHLPEKDSSASSVATMEPSVLLLSPLHPLRLSWQVRCQSLLAGARASKNFCHLASELDADCCPSLWTLTSGNNRRSFVVARGLSDYWSVMISIDDLDIGPHSEKFEALDLDLPEPIRTLSGMQADGMLSEVRDLLPAASKLIVSLEGSVNARERLFDGIVSWFSNQSNGGQDGAEPLSDWLHSIPLDLDIIDETSGSAVLSSSPLASLTESSSGSLDWYAPRPNTAPVVRKDLAMHTSLNIAGQRVLQGGAGAAATPRLETAVFPVWVSDKKAIRTPVAIRNADSDGVERKIVLSGGADNNQYLETHFKDKLFQSNSELEGFPSAGMDPAVLAHMLGDQSSHVWRYSRSAIGQDGYFVAAKSSPAILKSIAVSIASLAPGIGHSDVEVESILSEFGRRGLDSLSAAVGGGVNAMGALGLLVASKVLQPFSGAAGILPNPHIGDDALTVVVPLDSYDKKLAGIGRSLGLGSTPRPDLLAISVTLNNKSLPADVKLTPIEVKCYRGIMPTKKRAQHLDQQCRRFSIFLEKFFDPEVDCPESLELWSISRRKFLTELFLAGAHLLTHIKNSDWHDDLGRNAIMQICEDLMRCDPRVDVDSFGRLIVVDGSQDTCFKHHDTTADPDGFTETLQISRSEAVELLLDQREFTSKITSPKWGLAVGPRSVESSSDQPVPETTGSERGSVTPADEDPEQDTTETDDDGFSEATTVDDGLLLTSDVHVALGLDKHDEIVTWEPFKAEERLPNGHCVIVGQSGSGKTYAITEIMAPQVMQSGANIFALEFNDEFDGTQVLASPRAQRLNVAQGMNYNPLVIHRDKEDDYLNVTAHIYELADVLDSTFGLGVQQASKLRKALRELYKEYGIEMIADFDPENVLAWPEFNELQDFVAEGQRTQELMGRIEVLFDTNVFRGKQGTMNDLLAQTTILSLKDLPGSKVQNAVSALLLRGAYSTLAAMGQIDKQLRNVFVVDEAHKVANSKPIQTLIKEIRKFGGAVWLSSQEPSDFEPSVWANCASFVCLRVEDVEQAKLCSQKLDNNAELAEHLRALAPGQGYLRNNHYMPFRRLDFRTAVQKG